MNLTSSLQTQKELAKVFDIDIANDTFDVAAARFLDEVTAAISHESAEPSSERQRAFATSLDQDVTEDTKTRGQCQDRRSTFRKKSRGDF